MKWAEQNFNYLLHNKISLCLFFMFIRAILRNVRCGRGYQNLVQIQPNLASLKKNRWSYDGYYTIHNVVMIMIKLVCMKYGWSLFLQTQIFRNKYVLNSVYCNQKMFGNKYTCKMVKKIIQSPQS